MPESHPTRVADGERVYITCPGCGRHDWVSWPPERPTYHWKCFNCHKEFDLERGRSH
jgi:transposase-like protein